jgi:hypothetical protein
MISIVKKAYAEINLGEAFKIGNDSVKGKTGYGSLGEFISTVLPNIYIVAGLILFVLLIGGGFVIMTSSGNPDQQGKGAKAVTAAVIGFIIIFASYWLIQIIEVLTGIKIF